MAKLGMTLADRGRMGGSAGLGRILRFLVGGGLNTAVTYIIYLILQMVLSYQLAFLLAYAAGIVFSYFFNSTVVFKRQMSWTGMMVFPLVYLVQYAVSALVLRVIVEHSPVSAKIAPLLVSVLMLPLTFVLSRLVVSRFNRPNEGVRVTNE